MARRRSTTAPALWAAFGVLLGACASGHPPYRSFEELDYRLGNERVLWCPRARVDVRAVEIPAAGEEREPPILLLHAWATNMLIWKEVARELAVHRRVLLIDLPGHGKSGKPPGRYPPKRLAEAALDTLDAFGVARAVVIGNSLGGATALELAQLAPERIDRMVLIAAPGGAPLPEPLVALVESLAHPRQIESLSAEAWAVGWWVVAPSTPLADRMFEDILALRGSKEWSAWAAALTSTLTEVARYAPALERIPVKTLVLQGSADWVVWPSHGRALAARLPDGTLSILSGCGHFPQLECPREVLKAIRGFLGGRRARVDEDPKGAYIAGDVDPHL